MIYTQTMKVKEKNTVMVDLHKLPFTEEESDYFGKVSNKICLNMDDLIAIAVRERTDIHESTYKAVIEILSKIAIRKIADGATVEFGLSRHQLKVKGTFKGEKAKWDEKQHHLKVHSIPVKELLDAISHSKVIVKGKVNPMACINTVTDITSEKCNKILTPGGALHLQGKNIKIIGDEATCGIELRNCDLNKIYKIPSNKILENKPSSILFIMPTNLKKGKYEVCIKSKYCRSGHLLKKMNTIVFGVVLSVD